MKNPFLFNFKSDISNIPLPEKLNNPFVVCISDLARIAVEEFQEFISQEVLNWDYDFDVRPGKMFGVLVVQKQDRSYAYLATSSGELSRKRTCKRFTPPVFDESTDNYFINRDMTEITVLTNEIKNAKTSAEAKALKEVRGQKSKAVQKKLFENYAFLNIHGEVQNVLEIFEKSGLGKPPASTGECAAPKLLQYAFKNNLKPIALAEFWWGNTLKGTERKHKMFYPSCKNKCRPILEFMLDDDGLYEVVEE